ncbi:hypothetical protein ANN_08120 [Periplaneta americana]|uniref:Uncharacterized protein n=1 Tax=Periplaneta americana TaxID=6978 RepID=A0ABQ8T0H8_PERAM|nr:hypothetical protein ANN_08120 [Periplaneta americana]
MSRPVFYVAYGKLKNDLEREKALQRRFDEYLALTEQYWIEHGDLNSELSVKLQRVQNMCVRYVCNIRRRYDHISSSFASLSWLRLKERRTLHSLSLLFRILHTSTPNYLSSLFSYLYSNDYVNTTSLICGSLSISLHRTSRYSSSFTCRTGILFHSKNTKSCKIEIDFYAKPVDTAQLQMYR